MLGESSKQGVGPQPPGFWNLEARFQLGWRIHLSCGLPLLDLQRGKLYLRTPEDGKKNCFCQEKRASPIENPKLRAAFYQPNCPAMRPCLSSLSLYPWHLAQCLAYSTCSINMCWIYVCHSTLMRTGTCGPLARALKGQQHLPRPMLRWQDHYSKNMTHSSSPERFSSWIPPWDSPFTAIFGWF